MTAAVLAREIDQLDWWSSSAFRELLINFDEGRKSLRAVASFSSPLSRHLFIWNNTIAQSEAMLFNCDNWSMEDWKGSILFFEENGLDAMSKARRPMPDRNESPFFFPENFFTVDRCRFDRSFIFFFEIIERISERESKTFSWKISENPRWIQSFAYP